MQIRELDLSTLEWRKVDAKGNPPPYKTHTSAAVLADKWILRGGRKAGKFNVTNDTFTFDFKSLRQAVSLSPLSLSWLNAKRPVLSLLIKPEAHLLHHQC